MRYLPLLIQACAVTLVSAQTPTESDLPYGPHPRQVLDFYKAGTVGNPAPLLFFIHGGGWMTGDEANPDFLAKCLENGISVVSIRYRLLPDAIAAGIDPPVRAPLDDAARALQFTRSRAAEWMIDPNRIAACGGSAGGFTALWLAFAPDKADANSADLVARESTRVTCALAFVPQTTLDPTLMRNWIPNIEYGNHAFNLPDMLTFLAKRESLRPWIEQISPYSLVTADDPPVLLFYDSAPNPGQPHHDPPHSANFGAGLAPKLEAAGIEHEINYNNDYGKMRWPDLFGFLLEKLKE